MLKQCETDLLHVNWIATRLTRCQSIRAGIKSCGLRSGVSDTKHSQTQYGSRICTPSMRITLDRLKGGTIFSNLFDKGTAVSPTTGPTRVLPRASLPLLKQELAAFYALRSERGPGSMPVGMLLPGL